MIHSLRKEGKSLREIADTLKISKGATAKYDKLDSDGPECNTQYQYRRIPAQRQPFYIPPPQFIGPEVPPPLNPVMDYIQQSVQQMKKDLAYIQQQGQTRQREIEEEKRNKEEQRQHEMAPQKKEEEQPEQQPRQQEMAMPTKKKEEQQPRAIEWLPLERASDDQPYARLYQILQDSRAQGRKDAEEQAAKRRQEEEKARQTREAQMIMPLIASTPSPPPDQINTERREIKAAQPAIIIKKVEPLNLEEEKDDHLSPVATGIITGIILGACSVLNKIFPTSGNSNVQIGTQINHHTQCSGNYKVINKT